MRPWKPKNVKLTSIRRLRRYTAPLPMVGDPRVRNWHEHDSELYAAAVAAKRAEVAHVPETPL